MSFWNISTRDAGLGDESTDFKPRTAQSGISAKPLPKGKFRFIALDVETANGNASSICQIGLACVSADNSIQTYSTLINPEQQFEYFNTKLHGIDQKMVNSAPRFSDAFNLIAPLLRQQPVIQHSTFDKRAIEAACERCKLPSGGITWLNSVTVARTAWPEFKGNGGHGLGHLKQQLALDFHHHDAEEDARAAALVVLHAENRTGRSLEQLAQSATKQASAGRAKPTANPDGALFGQTVVFTGDMKWSHSDAGQRAAKIGLAVTSTVTRKTSFLVVGNTTTQSTKLEKAILLSADGHHVRLLSEDDFANLLSTSC